MKKLLMMAIALFATLNMNAQSAAGEMFVKPMFGLTYSTITKTDADMKFGIATGGEFGYNFTDNITFTGGLLYTMEGAKNDVSKTTLSYLNIPILLNYYVIPGLALKTGIQPGILLSQKTKVGKNEFTGTDGLNTVDITVPFGVSYEFEDFVIDARYNLGLLSIFKDDYREYDELTDGKNSFFMLTLGYKLDL